MCHVGSLCRGPKYSLLAHTSLTLQHVQEAFKSHDLSLAATGSSCASSAFARALSSPLIPSLYLCFQRRMLSGCPCMATCAAAWSPSLSASFSLSLAAGCRLRCQDFGSLASCTTRRHALIHGLSLLFHPAGAGPSPLERCLRRPQGARRCSVSRVQKTWRERTSRRL